MVDAGYQPTEDELHLEALVEPLVERMRAAPEGSAEREFCRRQLTGLRYSCEAGEGIVHHFTQGCFINADGFLDPPRTSLASRASAQPAILKTRR